MDEYILSWLSRRFFSARAEARLTALEAELRRLRGEA
jgi:hypothetical protein